MDEGMYYPVQGNEGMKLYVTGQKNRIKITERKTKEYREVREHIAQLHRELIRHRY